MIVPRRFPLAPWNGIADEMLPHGGLIVLVNAYFDESIGKARFHDRRDGSERVLNTLCIAGYLVEAERAKRLSDDWQAVLDEFGLPYFHMVDCAHGNGVFGALSKRDRTQVAARMIGNIKRWTYRGIGMSLNVSQFYALMPPEHPFIRTPYTLCFHAMTGGVQNWIKENKFPEKVAFFFEAGHASQSEANRLMQIIVSDSELRKNLHYAGHAFVPKEDSAGVQAADLLAWQFNRETRRQIENEPRPPRKDFESLTAHPHNLIFMRPEDYVRMGKEWGFDTTIQEANIKAADEYYASFRRDASSEQSS